MYRILLRVLLFTLAANVVRAADFTTTADNATPNVGDTIAVTMHARIPGNEALVRANQFLAFDNTKLELTAQAAGSAGGLVPDPRSLAEINATGEIRAGISSTSPISGTMTLGVFSFKALATGMTNVTSAPYSDPDGLFGNLLVQMNSTQIIPTTPADLPLTIGSGANTPPVTADDTYSTAADTVLNVAAPGVLGNDTDADGDALTAVKVSDPAHGTLTLNADGSFVYSPAAGYSGADRFTYEANDGTADSNLATVAIRVSAGENTAPVAADDSYSTAEDSALNVAAPGVLANDTDVDGDTLNAVKISDPDHGTLTLNADGSFTYMPAADYNGADSFTYKANDGTANSNTTTVAITVTAVNDAPVIDSPAWADPNPVTRPASTTLNVVAHDPDGDALAYAWTQESGPGTATFATPGAASSNVSFTAAGTYLLRVTVADGEGGSVTSDATVTVAPRAGDVNDDSVVNAIDLQIVIANFGKETTDPLCDPRADANGDGVVNALDLQIVIASFGT